MSDPSEPNAVPFLKLQRNDSNYLAYNRLERKNENWPEIVFLSGLMSDMSGTKANHINQLCKERGQAFTRFDYFGHGLSNGQFIKGTIGQWLDDSLAIIDQVTEGPLLLVGSSMGAWIMILAALARPHRVHSLVSIAAAPDFTEELIWSPLSPFQKQKFKEKGSFEIPSSNFSVTLNFVEEARQHLVFSKPKVDITVPINLIHGMADQDVPFSLSQRLYTSLRSEQCILTLIKNGDHRLNTPLALNRLSSILVEMSEYKGISN